MVPLKIAVPESFYDEEIRCDYLITRKMKEVWAILLDMLTEFDRVCKKHRICYYFCSGSLLGAIRHQGFIPWDDDIDLVLLREDYDRLIKIAKNEFIHPYFFQTAFNDPGYQYGYAHLRRSDTTGIEEDGKIFKFKFNQGIKIDLFPLDTVIGDPKLYDKQLDKAGKLLNKANFFYGATKEGVYWNPRFLVRFFRKIASGCMSKIMRKTGDKFFRDFECICKQYNNMDTELVASISNVVIMKKKCVQFPKEYFKHITYMPFEFIQVPVGDNYEKVLEMNYGDWRIPVVGTSVHGSTFYDTDRPYTDYL